MPADAPRADEVLITTHRIFASLDPMHRGLPTLHADLFDGRPAVALSAISTVGAIADVSSFPHLVRLISIPDEDLQCASVAALARNAHPEQAATLRGLLRATQSDRLREAVLEAIADASLGDAETIDLARRTARSSLVPPAARANAAGVLLSLAGPDCLDALIADGREEVLARVLERAIARPEAAARDAAPDGARVPQTAFAPAGHPGRIRRVDRRTRIHPGAPRRARGHAIPRCAGPPTRPWARSPTTRDSAER